MNMLEYLESNGYQAVHQLPDGRWVGVLKYFYTAGLCVGLTEWGLEYRYCYAEERDAVLACVQWNGQGDPPGPWIKLKGHPTRGEEAGPGLKAL